MIPYSDTVFKTVSFLLTVDRVCGHHFKKPKRGAVKNGAEFLNCF